MWVVRRLLLLVVLAECAGAAVQPSRSSPRPRPISSRGGPPNVILITLDTTRADRMGFLGSTRGLTPNLDALAKDGAVFTRAYSHVPLTPPSHATILTGTYPQFNHVDDFGKKLGKDLPYLPAILRARGYRTAAFVSSIILDPVQGSGPGFDRGFDTYDAGFHRRRPGDDRYQTIERRAEEVVARADAWLENHPRGPYFLWLHFYDAHDPYDPPEPFKSRYASALYDGEIAYADAAVGRFLKHLRSRGLYDRSAIAVMADHGEALGEHGETAHGVFLYDETIHVPLLVKLPGQRSAGRRVDSRAGLVDVAPTILQAVGVDIPKAMQGESLLPQMESAPGVIADRPAFAETDYPRSAFGWSSMRAWRTGKYLLVEAPRPELYDQSSDPHADQNVAPNAAAVTGTLKGQLDDFRRKTRGATTAPKPVVDPEQQEKLNALGYVASDSANTDDEAKAGPGIKDTKADPKDRIEIVNLLHDAILDVEENQFEKAIPLLEHVITAQSGIPIAYMQLGTAYTWLKQYDKAIPVLRKAVEMRPDTLMPHYELGLALSENGDWESATPEFEAAVQKSPKWAALHFSLAAAYARQDRTKDAQRQLETTLNLEPDNYRANLVLGRMLTLNGKPVLALPYLKKAALLQPSAPDPHLFMADTFARLGQKANAHREQAEGQRLRGTNER